MTRFGKFFPNEEGCSRLWASKHLSDTGRVKVEAGVHPDRIIIEKNRKMRDNKEKKTEKMKPYVSDSHRQVRGIPSKNVFRDGLFDTAYLKTNLKGRSVRGGATTLAAQGVRFFLHMTSTVVLARLLTPEDFGLIAMVSAVTGFLMMFSDMGLPLATVQKENIDHAQISTLFWINLAFSFGTALIIVGLAPVIAWFYHETRLIWITIALAGASVMGGLTAQHQALLTRKMHFGILAASQISNMVVGILAAIVSAWYGAGYWALVIKELAGILAGGVVVWVACRWHPSLPVRDSGIRSMLAFGRNMTGFNFLNYFARNADNVLIGRFWGSSQLGLYTKAYGLLMLPINQVTAPIAAVAIPALSRLQNDPEQYRRYYYRAISTIAYITMPTIAMLGALSSEIIRIVLGSQWTGSAAIFKVLAFAALVQPVVNPVGWVYVSLAQTNRQFLWALFAVPVTVASFFVGLRWGAFGVAVSYTICFYCVLTVPGLWWAFRHSPISIGGWLKAISCPLVISLSMYLVVTVVHRIVAVNSLIVTLLISTVSGLACFALVAILCRRVRQEVRAIVSILRMLKTEVRPT